MQNSSNKSISPLVRSIIFLVLMSIGYVTLNIAIRLLEEGFEPMTQTYLRIFFSFLLLPLIFYKQISYRKFLTLPKKDWLILILMGTIGYSVGVYFITQGALQTKIVNVSIIYSTTIFFGYFSAILFLKKKFEIRIFVLLLASLLGITFIAGKSFIPSLGQFGQGDLFVLLAAATMSYYYTGRQMLSKALNNAEITTITMLIAALSGIVMANIAGERLNIEAFQNVNVLIGLGIGIILNIGITYLGNYAFEHIDLVLGNQILLSENVFALIFGYLIYHEFLTFPEIVGSMIVIASVILGIRLVNKKSTI